MFAPAQTCYGMSFVLERSVSFNVSELSLHPSGVKDRQLGRREGLVRLGKGLPEAWLDAQEVAALMTGPLGQWPTLTQPVCLLSDVAGRVDYSR